jgi:hypothetical protein
MYRCFVAEMELSVLRILLKVLLFPITLALSLFIAVCRFICCFSGAVLSVISFIMFVIALLALIIPTIETPFQTTIIVWLVAFLISPFGIPLFADWLLDKLEDLNFAIKSI